MKSYWRWFSDRFGMKNKESANHYCEAMLLHNLQLSSWNSHKLLLKRWISRLLFLLCKKNHDYLVVSFCRFRRAFVNIHNSSCSLKFVYSLDMLSKNIDTNNLKTVSLYMCRKNTYNIIEKKCKRIFEKYQFCFQYQQF